MGTNDKDLIAESIINIARECVAFGVKSVFISSFTFGTDATRLLLVKKRTLKAKCLIHNFHFIDNSNIKKEHLWKNSLYLNRSGNDLLTNNSLRNINNFLRNVKDQEIVT